METQLKFYSIKNVYNSYVIQEDFSYTFNNIDNWLHTRIEIGSRQRKIDKKTHTYDNKCSL